MAGNKQDAQEAAKKWRFTVKAWPQGYYDNLSPRIFKRALKKK
jgi:hypothetical protein